MSVDELLKKLDIQKDYEHEGDRIVIQLADSDEWMKLYNKLSKAKDICDLDIDTGVQLDIEKWSAVFLADDYDLTLLGDVTNDDYKLVIKAA